jgi:hypothetical protein
MRPNGLVVPATELHVESYQPLSHPRGRVSGPRRIVINMGMVTFDDPFVHFATSPLKSSAGFLSNLPGGSQTKRKAS